MPVKKTERILTGNKMALHNSDSQVHILKPNQQQTLSGKISVTSATLPFEKDLKPVGLPYYSTLRLHQL